MSLPRTLVNASARVALALQANTTCRAKSPPTVPSQVVLPRATLPSCPTATTLPLIMQPTQHRTTGSILIVVRTDKDLHTRIRSNRLPRAIGEELPRWAASNLPTLAPTLPARPRPSTLALPNRAVSDSARTAIKARMAVAPVPLQAIHIPSSPVVGPQRHLPPHRPPRTALPRVSINAPDRRPQTRPLAPHPLPPQRHRPRRLTSTCENRPRCHRARSQQQRNACLGTTAILLP